MVGARTDAVAIKFCCSRTSGEGRSGPTGRKPGNVRQKVGEQQRREVAETKASLAAWLKEARISGRPRYAEDGE